MRKKLKVHYRKSYRASLRKIKVIHFKKRFVFLFVLLTLSLILYGLMEIENNDEPGTYIVSLDTPENTFLFPAEGTITALEKDGTHENNGAVDICNSQGTPILAAMDGKIIFEGKKGTYGNCIIIEHNNDFSTLYAHLYEIDVGEDEAVTQGQIIGKMGSTGNSTGNHLHFEIRKEDERQNMLDYFSYLKVDLHIVRDGE
ncbi:MAG: M23 family metallopeptidase [Eubacteriales bacterium]